MKTLVDIVAAEGLVSEPRLAAAARHAMTTGEPLVVGLVEHENVPEGVLAEMIARHVGRAVVMIGEIDAEAVRHVPHDLARQRRLVPLALETDRVGSRRLRIAMADPTDHVTIRELEATTGCLVEAAPAALSNVEAALRRAYRDVVTAIMKRDDPPLRRMPFSGTLDNAKSGPKGRANRPAHRLEDEAPLELRHRALLDVLVANKLISYDEFLNALRDLMAERER